MCVRFMDAWNKSLFVCCVPILSRQHRWLVVEALEKPTKLRMWQFFKRHGLTIGGKTIFFVGVVVASDHWRIRMIFSIPCICGYYLLMK